MLVSRSGLLGQSQFVVFLVPSLDCQWVQCAAPWSQSLCHGLHVFFLSLMIHLRLVCMKPLLHFM